MNIFLQPHWSVYGDTPPDITIRCHAVRLMYWHDMLGRRAGKTFVYVCGMLQVATLISLRRV